MKIIKIIGHPVLVMSMFLLVIISGQHFGGFYLLYILMGLPNGAPHALIALTGLITLFIGYKIYRSKPHVFKPILYVIGVLIMSYALLTFFENSQGYNNATFYQTVPLISLIIYGTCSLCCLIYAFWLIAKIYRSKAANLGITSR